MFKVLSPHLLTPSAYRSLVEVTTQGGTIRDAAKMVGVPRRVLDSWLSYGKALEAQAAHAGEPENPQDLTILTLWRDLESATGHLRGKAARSILEASSTDWRAAQYYLERMDPEQWADRTQAELQAQAELFLRAVEENTDAFTYTKILEQIAASDPCGQEEAEPTKGDQPKARPLLPG